MIGASRRLEVAVVDDELPYPVTSGKRIRTLSLLERLAPRHRITYITRRSRNRQLDQTASDYLASHGITPLLVDDPPPPKTVGARGLGFYARLAGNLLSSQPYVVEANDGRRMRAAVARYAAEHAVDVWQCEWTPCAPLMSAAHAARTVIMAHNVESQIWQRYLETETNAVKRWYIRRQWQKFARFERATFAAFGHVVAVTGDDAERIRTQFGRANVDVVDNGVDPDFFTPAPVPRDPYHLLFLGSLDWRPNLDAVRLLLTRVLPEVRAAEPRAHLSLVGCRPPEALRAEVSRCAGVELAADVPDVRPYLWRCGALVVPLRIGGGSRLKILEALACCAPVISTRVGAEGLALQPGEHLYEVDDVGELAAVLIAAMRRPEPLWEMARRGRQVVAARYDWNTLADKLERVWLACAGQTQPTG